MRLKDKSNAVAVRWIRLRILLVASGLLFGFLLLVGRSFQIQLFQQEGWATAANKQVQRNLRFEPRRGEIYDRNGQELAVSIEMDSLAADPRLVEEPKKTARRLAGVIGTSSANLHAKLCQSRRFVYLKNYLPPRQAEAVQALKLKGIHFVKESRRYYPNVELAGHLLGFVGRDHHGLEGVELSQDPTLRGVPDRHPGAKDARGQIIYTHGLPSDSGPQGHSLRLTIDKRIQYIAEKELQQTVNAFEAKSGMAVVMAPETGEILAMGVFPPFNPNRFSSSRPSVWRNRTVTDAFEPGSIFKIFLVAAAMEEGVVQPDDLFYCEQGNYRIRRHTIHDIKKFGWLSLAQVVRFSSNIGAAKVGKKLGANRFYRYIRAFGFGSPTGIGLPGETSGLIRAPDEWSEIDLAATSFGQSLSVSAIQFAMALGAIANDGLLMRPLLIKEVLDAKGETMRENTPRVVRRVLSAANAKRLKRLLADVISPGGTGAQAALDRYQAAGKTGTAQKSNRKRGGYSDDCYTASFVGFVPVENPSIVVVVVINEPQKGLYGGVVAAPAFRQIARQTLQCLQVPPEKVKQTAKNVAFLDGAAPLSQGRLTGMKPAVYDQTDLNDPTVMPDLTGLSLRAALDRLCGYEGSINVQGSGRVVGQSPGPGSELGATATCSLFLRTD